MIQGEPADLEVNTSASEASGSDLTGSGLGSTRSFQLRDRCVEVLSGRTAAAKPAWFEGECQHTHPQSSFNRHTTASVHSACVPLYTCTNHDLECG